MCPTLIELCPNRLLLDSNFDGYKLSLQEISSKKKQLVKPIDRILLNSSQYTLLHAKLYGLHNHLVGDNSDENDSVYFIDKDWNVCKTYLDPFTGSLVDPIVVWQIPRTNERKSGDYNVSLVFVNNSLAVIADGAGVMYVVNTGSRNDDDVCTLLFSDQVIGSDEGFIIVDAVSKTSDDSLEEMHILLQSLKQDSENERFSTILHWITLSKSVNGFWHQVSLKQLKANSDLQYAALERECNAVYVVSDSGCKFTLNSDCPVAVDIKNKAGTIKIYQWSQTLDEITMTINLPENANKELVCVKCIPKEIEIKYNGSDLVSGELYQLIDADLTTWLIEKCFIKMMFIKKEKNTLMWPELLKGDEAGDYIPDSNLVQEVHDRLKHICSDNEAIPQSGTTFNSQQIEECDYETDKAVIFERLSGFTNEVTHKVHLGSHQILLTPRLNLDLPPAVGIRHDVDVCLWQPQGSGETFSLSHEGTLLAFGYVQASKQNRKFSVCAPNLSYSVICEASGHLFIYRQNKPVTSTELRNRTTGQRVRTVAQQQVVNCSNDEIIGIHATNKTLFLLCETSITALNL